MSVFRPGQSARVAHSSLKDAISTLEKTQKGAVLWFTEIMQRGLYRDLGYSSINQYAQQELGWSRTRTTDFIQLAQKLERLPEVKKQVASGELGYTKAREVVKVADGKNEKQWLEVARGKSRRELETEVKRAKRAAVDQVKGQVPLLPGPQSRPVAISTRVSLEMSAEQLARYEVLWEKIRKRGGVPANQVEALLSLMAGFLENETEMPPGGASPQYKSMCTNVLTVKRPPFRQVTANLKWVLKKPSAPNATPKSARRENAIQLPSRPRPGARHWRAIGISAGVRAVSTHGFWRFTT